MSHSNSIYAPAAFKDAPNDIGHSREAHLLVANQGNVLHWVPSRGNVLHWAPPRATNTVSILFFLPFEINHNPTPELSPDTSLDVPLIGSPKRQLIGKMQFKGIFMPNIDIDTDIVDL
jgi:hypothetical protein